MYVCMYVCMYVAYGIVNDDQVYEAMVNIDRGDFVPHEVGR